MLRFLYIGDSAKLLVMGVRFSDVTVEEKIARHARDGTLATREIVMQFHADVADGMPWKFIPTQREARLKQGESALAFYTAENRSSTPITGMSTYNVTHEGQICSFTIRNDQWDK